MIFQSTQPEWAATSSQCTRRYSKQISIHAARMGCDVARFSSASPTSTFQSTQPEWAATRRAANQAACNSDFNPRSPNGLRHRAQCYLHYPNRISIHAARMGCDIGCKHFEYRRTGISIHAARMGCDVPVMIAMLRCTKFQSTQPEWAATMFSYSYAGVCIISIHAARMGCDFLTRVIGL